MGIRLLGPLDVVGARGALNLTSRKERALVAALALKANTVVTNAALVDVLWADDPPRTAVRTLKSYVSRLRSALAAADAEITIESEPGGYRLRTAAESVDVVRVAAMLDQARDAMRADDPAWAAVILTEASRLFDGPPLAEFADEHWAAGDAARLSELRLVIIEERVDADLACGRHGALVAELEALCASHPLRERMWAQRIVALYRSGRQADALRAYQELRTRLGEELGIDPSPELRALEAAVLSQAETLEWSAPPVMPSPLPAQAVDLPVGVVTFMLTDIEGSTRLWDRSPAAMAEALRAHDAIIGDAVGAAHGRVIKSKGEGDSTVSVFARATDAAAAAVAIQRELRDTFTRDGDFDLSVRIALHTGEAELRDGDYFGGTLNRAARLRGLAEGGDVLCSRAVVDVIGDALPDGTVVVDLGLHQLRDLSRAEHLFALAETAAAPVVERRLRSHGEVRAHDRQIPLPAALEVAPWGAFVGRDAQREAITTAVASVRTRRDNQLILVPGEPGIGKTTLVAQAARDAHAAGAIVLYGRCDEEFAVPYAAFAEAIGHLVTHAPGDLLRRHIAAYGPVLARLVPSLVERAELPSPTAADADAERQLLFAAIVNLLRMTGEIAPVLLIVDDLHWADAPTVQLLQHLVAAPDAVGSVVAVTFRPHEIPPDHPLDALLVRWRRDGATRRLPLVGFDQPDVEDLVRAATNEEVSIDAAAFAGRLVADTGGNPFFVAEILRDLAESGTVQQELGQARGGGALAAPDSVRDVIRARAARLGERAHHTLTLASVIGVDFDVATLGRIAQLPPEAVLDILDDAEAASFVRERGAPGDYAFNHALLQETLYQSLSATRRSHLHQSVAEALESSGDGAVIGEIARHWVAARTPAARGPAVRASIVAGEAALTALAPEEAVRHFAQAIELFREPDDPGFRLDAQIGLGVAQRLAGDPQHRATLLSAAAEARARSDTARLVAAVLGSTRGVFSSSGEVDVERVEAFKWALEALPVTDSPERALVLANLCAELTYGGSFDERLALGRDANDMAARLGDPALRLQVQNTMGMSLMVPATLETRVVETRDALELAQELGDPILEFWAANNRSMTAHEAGMPDEAKRCAERMTELSGLIRQPQMAWVSAYRRTWLALLSGDLAAGERLIEEAVQIGNEGGQPDAPMAWLSGNIMLRRQAGTLAELAPLLSEFAAVMDIPALNPVLAMALVEQGDTARARTLLDEAAAVRFTNLYLDYLWLAGMELYADTAAQLRATDAAAILLELLAPWHAQSADVGGGAFPPIARCLGSLATVLARFDDAEHFLAEAEEIAGRGYAPFWQADVALRTAELCVARGAPGDEKRARDCLDGAIASGRRFGFAGLVRRATELLDNLG